jgi:outer membrane lipoprotein-sorting protein
VKFLRTLSTGRLLILVALVTALAAGGAAIAVAAGGGSGATPPDKPLAQAIQDAVSAQPPAGISADITFTNKLFPSGALLGQAGSALMSGATGRLWATNDGRGRLELQSDAGDVQIVWNRAKVTVYDASSNSAYVFTLPAKPADATTPQDKQTPPTLAEITDFLTQLGNRATLSGAQPSNVAGQPAYTVEISPSHDGGLLGSAQLAWDAIQGIPLRIAIYAQGSSSPVLELKATNISYGAVSDSDVNVTPPAGTKVIAVNPPAADHGTNGSTPAVTGLDAVTAAAGFPVTAPATLVGLPRQDVRLVGSGSGTVLAVYGQGLGAIALVERKADTTAAKGNPLSSLPTVALDGVTAHELATQLGTIVEWQRAGVDYVLAGSLPPAAAEAAARELK